MNILMESPVYQAVSGLCATCDDALWCTHPRALGVPVLECDDASTLLIAIAPTTGIEAARRQEPPPRIATKGLCAMCERFSSCTFPKLEGGVWHCEEFE